MCIYRYIYIYIYCIPIAPSLSLYSFSSTFNASVRLQLPRPAAQCLSEMYTHMSIDRMFRCSARRVSGLIATSMLLEALISRCTHS